MLLFAMSELVTNIVFVCCKSLIYEKVPVIVTPWYLMCLFTNIFNEDLYIAAYAGKWACVQNLPHIAKYSRVLDVCG